MELHPSISAFWNWFKTNEKRYRDIAQVVDEEQQQELLTDILEVLNNYNPELYLEFDYDQDTKLHKIIITANGNEGFIDAAEQLANAAIPIDGWQIDALKQPDSKPFTINLDGGDIESEEVLIEPVSRVDNPGRVGLKVHIPEVEKHVEDPYFTSAIYALIETVIGEKSLAKDISLIQLSPPDETFERGNCIVLKDLPQFILDYKTTLKEDAHQNHDELR